MSHTRPAAVVVLAAGEGTRMKSRTPKMLHGLGGRTLLGHALAAARGTEPERLVVVVRHERDAVAGHALELDPDITVADQDAIPGTGRAVQCALGALDGAAEAAAANEDTGPGRSGGVFDGAIVVMAGDTPLLDAETLGQMLEAHNADGNAITVLTTTVANPTGYGRILRDDAGAVVGVVEERDATQEQRRIHEINTSTYVFDAAVLREALDAVGRDNDQGEVYLTDVIALAHTSGRPVRAIAVDDSWLVEGVNDRVQLAALGAELNRRIVEGWMRAGVTVVDPATTWIDIDVELSPDVTILPGTQLHGATTIGEGSVVGPDTTLTDVRIGSGVTVSRTHGSEAILDDGAAVGPFAYLRPGTRLGAEGKIGTFVETKNAEIGPGAKVPHLTYVGDAEIGEGSNIGASSVFVNYDGVHKHRTTIGKHARTGSDNMFVAPVTVGDGAYTGAGTTVREDVPPGALSVSGAGQRIIAGWVLRRRRGTPSAEAAETALATEGLSDQARAERARAGAAGASAERRETDSPGNTDEGDTDR